MCNMWTFFCLTLLVIAGCSSCSPQLAAVSQQRLEKMLNIRTTAGSSSIVLNSPANELLVNSSSSNSSSQPKLVFGEWRLRQLLPLGGSVAADAVQLQQWLGSSRGSLRSFSVDLSGVSAQFDLLIGNGGLGGSFSIGVKYFATFAACSQTRCSIASAMTSFTIQDSSSESSADAATVVPIFISAASALSMIIIVIFDVVRHDIKCKNRVGCSSQANAASNHNENDYLTHNMNSTESESPRQDDTAQLTSSGGASVPRHPPPPPPPPKPSFLASG